MKRAKTKTLIEGPFLARLRESFGDNLLSVTAYGSYVSGEFLPGVSDVNILVILSEPDGKGLAAFGKSAHSLIRRCRITPLVLTRKEFVNSADVFPMEYQDIRGRNIVLVGEDETKSLTLTRENLRHQLEGQLRGTVASLRQVVIASRGRRRVLRHYLKGLFGAIRSSLRGLLLLKDVGGEDIPDESDRLLERLESEFGIEIDSFRKLSHMRRGEKIEPRQLADEVLSSLRKLIATVDVLS
jgi:predicted nucleotidyltransferase